MTIEFNCPHCQKFLRTADDKAGRTAKCPGCGNTINVPGDPEAAFGAADEFDYGDDYGADDYGAEGAAAGMKKCPMCGEEIKAAAVRCRYCGEDLDEPAHRAGGGYLRPHRGGMILTFGIISLIICPIIFGPLAWVMGNQDLSEMAAGTMDRSGEGITKAGKICGIIGVCLIALNVVLMCIMIPLMGAMQGM